jgi:hypothetical protein
MTTRCETMLSHIREGRLSRHLMCLPALFFAALTLSAQEMPQSGDRVRLGMPCSAAQPGSDRSGLRCRIEGSFLRAGMDSITLTQAGESKSYSVNGIDRFEVSQGLRSHALLGAVIGFVAGAGITYLIVESGGSTSLCDQSANQDAIGSGECIGLIGLGGAIGAGVGAIVGGRIRTEKWSRIPLEGLQVTLRRGQVGLTMVLAF